jgi:cardiolipin synthase
MKKMKPLPAAINRFSLAKVLRFIFTRAFFFGSLVVMQALLLFLTTADYFDFSGGIYAFSLIFNLTITLYLVSTKDNPAYKMAWLFFIFLIPPTGGLIYLYSRLRHLPRRTTRQQDIFNHRVLTALRQDERIWRKIQTLPATIKQQFVYAHAQTQAPVYDQTTTTYFPSGELFFADLKKRLQQAHKYIFLEFFIIRDEDSMWTEILAILKAKVKEGVEVRLMYDDMGSLLSLPSNFVKQMAKHGINTRSFNRFRPFLQMRANNRDHRKIVVIDGKTAYVGGVNLADEYINRKLRFGFWKDAVVKLEGAATWSLTLFFLQMWNSIKQTDLDLNHYQTVLLSPVNSAHLGLVLPFVDEPQGNDFVAENIYLNLITKAKERLWLMTPYLVIDNEMFTALVLAAKNGVDVRLIVPSVPDKWYVHSLSSAFYAGLLEAGVKIYEYLPGFIHAKTIIADGEVGVVGTINLDYRSFYLHFEAGILMYQTPALAQLQEDFEQTFNECQLVALETVREVKFSTRVLRSVLRLVAPLF